MVMVGGFKPFTAFLPVVAFEFAFAFFQGPPSHRQPERSDRVCESPSLSLSSQFWTLTLRLLLASL
jgi:hypothetical protein